MAEALQPAVQRPRAEQGAINAVQAVVLQVEPPPAADMPHKRTNFQILRARNLRYSIITLSYCFCMSLCFPLC